MPQYEPPPASLEHLNPIQRYMQKGTLETADWIRLGLILGAYFIARPWIDELFKWFFKSNSDLKEGEAVQKEYAERKTKARIEANAIRGTKKKTGETKSVSFADSTTSGSNVNKESAVVNRKSKPQGATDLRTEEEKLLDWDDEEAQTLAKAVPAEKADVVAWLDKWDK